MNKFAIPEICIDCVFFKGVCDKNKTANTPACLEAKTGDSGVTYVEKNGVIRMVETRK